MSDPVTNVEIEDVLSSIRKLVSEKTQAAPERVDALILTPDHRVQEMPERDAYAQPEGEIADAETPAAEADEPAIEMGASEEEAEADTAFDAQPGFEELAQDESDILDAGDGLDEPVEAEGFDAVAQPLWPDAPVADAVADDDQAPRMSRLEQAIAELEEAVAKTNDAWEPDGVETNDNDPQEVSSGFAEWAQTEDVPEDVISFPSRTEDAMPEDAETIEDEAEIDAAPEQAPQAVDEVAPPEDAETYPEFPGEDGPEFDAPQPPFPEETNDEPSLPDETDEAAPPQGYVDDPLAMGEVTIDEEALQELVSEIVRSELQGELGERITRNVRKLVRREIHRALTTQNLI